MKLLFQPQVQFLLTILIVFPIAGCGGKGSTKVSYSAPVAPIGISFNVDSDGAVSVAAGIATPVGTFAIEREFPTRQETSYLVFRNRRLGTDQVFEIGSDGHVDLHFVGEHNLRITHEGRAFVIDADAISGTINISVTPPGSAAASAGLKKAILGKWKIISVDNDTSIWKIIWEFTKDGRVIRAPGVDGTYVFVDDEHIEYTELVFTVKLKVVILGDGLRLRFENGTELILVRLEKQ